MKTSARNQFPGRVTRVTPGAVNDEVELEIAGGARIVATISSESRAQLGLETGKEAIALIKASSILLMVGGDGAKVSARNRLTGKVSKLTKGAVNSEVVLGLAGGATAVAIVTNDSVTTLGLAEGGEATALFKASSVIVGVDG